MTPKTWDELVIRVADALDMDTSLLPNGGAFILADRALRALRAAGLAVVDEEVLATIRDWCGEGTEDFADAESVHIKIGRRVTIFMTLGDLRALSAGELAPPDKGEG